MKVLIAALNTERFPDPVYPLGADYVAFSVQRAGYEVQTFDAMLADDPVKELSELIATYQPDVIGLSIRNVDNTNYLNFKSYTSYYWGIVQSCRSVSNAIIVLGGSAFAVFPNEYMETLLADYGIVGEGEYAFINLLQSIEKGILPFEKVIYSQRIKKIDFNYFTDRHLFDNEYYYTFSGSINIQTKRGCAFKCSYCTYPKIEGVQYRYRSPQNVVDEIEFWFKKGYQYFFFVDSVFNQPEKYAESICKEIIKRKIDIRWTGFFMPKIKNERFVKLCKESGLTSMDFGTDALSKETIQAYQKSFTLDEVFQSCEWCRKYDIKFNHSLILGGPGETFDTLEETIDNVNRTLPVSVIAYLGVRLFPGTPIASSFSQEELSLKPHFFISEDIKNGVYDFLKEKLGNDPRWIIPGLMDKNPKFMEKLRIKGKKGPLWELI